MDALLTSLIACFLGEMGDRTQLLTIILATRYRQDMAVLSGIALASLLNAALSAAGGWFLSPLLTNEARTLFLALSFVLAGAGIILPVRQPDPLAGWRLGAFATSALGMFILGFGDKSQFMILGLSTRMADPVFTAIGGGLGTFLACLPVVLLRQRYFTDVPVTWVRRIALILFLIIGISLGLSALRLL